jgi:hypothetical protein
LWRRSGLYRGYYIYRCICVLLVEKAFRYKIMLQKVKIVWTCNFIVLKLYVNITYLLTHSIEQSPPWEANWFSASQEIQRILWNLKVHYRIHRCLPPFCILSLSISPGEYFLTRYVLWWGVVSTLPNPQGGGLPLVGCPWLHIQCICSYRPYWWLFLHPHPEYAPCRGDRDPIIMGDPVIVGNIVRL